MNARNSPARGLRCLLTWSAAVLGTWEAAWGFPHVSGLDIIVVRAIMASGDISKSSVQRAALGGVTSEQAPGSAICLLGVPLCHPQCKGSPVGPHSQGREHCWVPARPASVFLARPALAPACLLPRLPECLPLRELLPVLPGFWRCQGLGAAGSTRANPFGPSKEATFCCSWYLLQNFLPSHQHPPPLTSGSFRMQLNTSALKISGANCLVMKTLITGQLKP